MSILMKEIKVRVFYANKLYSETVIDSMHISAIRQLTDITTLNLKIYNGGYVQIIQGIGSGWYRCDLTPVLEEDVPKTLKLLTLLMN